jgi:[acyl-carrier-protein] S-malonyltransferase
VGDRLVARQLLLRQLTSPVRWSRSMQTMLARGLTNFLEVGPGNVLTGLLRRIDRAAGGRALGNVEEVEGYLREEVEAWN